MTTTQSKMTPAEHLAEVQASIGADADARLAEVLRAAVKHMHQFVEEVGLTREEWFTGIQFLTAVGQKCDDLRQEFILMSDTLGVSMLVEMVNQHGRPGTTEPTVFGPFHVEGAPRRALGDSIVDLDVGGAPLVMSGVVRSADGTPIAGADVDVWQTAPNGSYDVQDDTQPLMNFRGIFTTGADGRFEFRTYRPVAYQIPGDGPVGELLKAAGRHNWRPAHVHFMITADGHEPLITHLFDSESEYLDSDAVFGVRGSLIADMSSGECEYDFVLEPEGT